MFLIDFIYITAAAQKSVHILMCSILATGEVDDVREMF